MRPQTQKPDGITPQIRQEYKDLGVKFIEPPSGFGCDFVVFRWHHDFSFVTFIEVKSPQEVNNLTPKEKRLQEFAGQNYVVVTTLDHALAAAGWML